PLTIIASVVLVALAAVPELTSWLQYLPVLAAHSYGYVAFQVANMLGIYQATYI
ncbi:hypothetical protein LPJ77_006191, partial [Coemansia sp. RSA 2523]